MPALIGAQESRRQSQQEELAERRREKAERLEPERVSSWEARVRSLEEANFPSNILVKGFNGFRPVIGGMPSGSGFVGGVGWGHGVENERYEVDAIAAYSTRGFSQLSAKLDLASVQSRFPIRAFVTAAYQDYPGLRFFGLGNDSAADNRVFFGQSTELFGVGVTAALSRFLDVQAEASRAVFEVGPANRDPSIQNSGLPAQTAFENETTFYVFGAKATVNLLDRYGFPPVGLQLSVGAQRYDDRGRRLGSFTRVIGELRGQVALGSRNRRLAFRARMSQATSDAGDEVPVYLMETVGGSGSLRGYAEYRFRDLGNLLLTTEYRWEIWTYTDLALFYDAAKVFASHRDLNFRDMHSGYGFGVRVRAPDDMFLNIDLARSPEGFKLHVGGGPRF